MRLIGTALLSAALAAGGLALMAALLGLAQRATELSIDRALGGLTQ